MKTLLTSLITAFVLCMGCAQQDEPEEQADRGSPLGEEVDELSRIQEQVMGKQKKND